ncbi:hypothetical protein CKM354_000380300 [Cercospora kikuchii]|uniref:CENP-V/GFA domain-containing protein n=1 Tax=Cercospora kikuchii TaxID=84275 RepID=A0A9P3CC13_9PEZI|nr:uncharacterized protein CKM354_000380300 [Cercospora kikuchii]GIZ40467.1 hypothetical protein CKM354_000380300 [Cercospora kikuchii]
MGENEPAPIQTYRGNCHCAAFVFEIDLPQIHTVTECNCSICYRKGYLWVTSSRKDLNVEKGDVKSLSSYTFGPEKLAHRFCPTCASPVMAEETGGDALYLNVRVLQDLDIWALKRQQHDGAAEGGDYAPPEYEGKAPTASKGQQSYIGSCHCGGVGLALVSKPLDDTYSGRIAECTCSVCVRNAYIWIYPQAKQVVLSAAESENIGRYSFSHHVLNKTFCTVCGVCMTNEYAHRSKDELKELGAVPTRGFAQSMKNSHPLNLRILHDIDWDKLPKPMRNDGARKISPKYKDP